MSDKFKLLPDIISNNKTENVVYISPSGTSGYAQAAKGYIYKLLMEKTTVQWIPYETTDSLTKSDNTEFDNFIEKSKKVVISRPTKIIIHSIPTGWDSLLINSNVRYDSTAKIIGRMVWEFEKLIPEWILAINNSTVSIVSVPNEWNKQILIKNGVTKNIVVDPHVYVDCKYIQYSLKQLYSKCLLLTRSNISISDFESHYKFYCISQLIERKGVFETVETYCKTFTSTDKVLLILKCFRNDYSIEEQIECSKIFKQITDQYDHAPILYIKDRLTYDEIKSLHNIGDCYLSLTKTEGVGLGAFDAHNNNNPVIITGYGGQVEYLGKNYAGLVSYELISVNSTIFKGCYLDDTYKWANVDVNNAKKLLIEKINSPIEVKKQPSNVNILPHELSILYVGQYGTSGYATAAKQYIANYIMNGIPITWEPLYFDSSKLDDTNYVNILAKSAINKKIEYNTVILHCTPDLWKSYIDRNKNRLINKKIIGYTVWETSQLKPEWIDPINSVSEVWCPSEYNKKIFIESGITIPVKVVPHIFFKNQLPLKPRVVIKDAKDGYYTFYNISELNERKNVLELVECFCQEFSKDERVQLILKIHFKDYTKTNIEYCRNQIQSILDKYPDHAHVVLIQENIQENQILALHSYGDCYVSLTRSEGFGLSIFDAVNYGKKIIVTGYGGHLDYLPHNYGGLVNYKLVKVNGMDNFNSNYNHNNQFWAQPNLQHFKKLIRKYN